ncbi:MAG: hypothetical protein CO170_02350 [candidate division SR1 bacterium CG_4_9_14_3_um_filter_40_9]|nr:MAG: hypothetical protein CO170_02350 [candidate division SR1 bacterium CG_4_9_14_3_um_filter_40_9]
MWRIYYLGALIHNLNVMATIENIGVWNKAVEFAKDVYKLCKDNANIYKDFGLRDQIQRSALSIPSNIAEGADRGSQKEFLRFLFIARGSCSELKTQMHIVKKLDYIADADFKNIMDKLDEIHKMINGFINTIKKKIEVNQ